MLPIAAAAARGLVQGPAPAAGLRLLACGAAAGRRRVATDVADALVPGLERPTRGHGAFAQRGAGGCPCGGLQLEQHGQGSRSWPHPNGCFVVGCFFSRLRNLKPRTVNDAVSRMALACARAARRRAPEKNPGTRRRTAARIVLGPSRSLRMSGPGRSTSRKRGTITHACTGRLSFDVHGPSRSPDHTALPCLATEGSI